MTPKTPDPTVWNPQWTLMQKLRRLQAIDPEIVRVVELLVDDALQRLDPPIPQSTMVM